MQAAVDKAARLAKGELPKTKEPILAAVCYNLDLALKCLHERYKCDWTAIKYYYIHSQQLG